MTLVGPGGAGKTRLAVHLALAFAAGDDATFREGVRFVELAAVMDPALVERTVAGEVVFRVPPLGLPQNDQLASMQDSDAVQLFIQRARASHPDFDLDSHTAAPIRDICRHVDGLPLAIELAASHIGTLAAADIALRLAAALPVARIAPHGAPHRQRTLEAAVAWSYDLLDPEEQCLFNRLTVFAGGFPLDGADQLEAARRQHALYVLRLAEAAGAAHQGPEMVTWGRRLYTEWDNLRIVDDWAHAHAETEIALRLGAALWWWWSRPDYQAEGRLRLDRARRMPRSEAYPVERGRVTGGLAFMAVAQSDLPVAATLAAAALETAQALGDASLEGVAMLVDSMVRGFHGDLEGAQRAARARQARPEIAQPGSRASRSARLARLIASTLPRRCVPGADHRTPRGGRVADEMASVA